MEIQGKIIKVLAPIGGVSKAGKEWKKQDFVVEMSSNTQYPKRISFNIFGEDKIQQYALREGEDVSVKFEIDSHEYNGRWFNEVRAWDVQKIMQSQIQPQQVQPQQGHQQPVQQNFYKPQSAPQPTQVPFPQQSQQGGVSGEELPF